MSNVRNSMIYNTAMENRPYSYKLWHIGQKTSHKKNATEFLTPLFTENVSLFDIWPNMAQVSNSIEFFTAVKKFQPNSSQSWYIRQNTPYVKIPTEFLTPVFAENIICKISH